MTPYRAQLYRLVFGAAAVYNAAFGVWAAVWPQHFFDLAGLAPPRYPSIWACLGMVIGLYGAGYAYAARHLDRARPFIAIGLAGKLLGPAGWVVAVTGGEWPIRTITLILFNDVVWWLPFALFLLEGTRYAARVRAMAPAACAALNAAAFGAMALGLRRGTEIVPAVEDRLRYIAEHPSLWRGGWAVWIAAAMSLVAFYAWWGAGLSTPRRAIAAVVVAAAGLCADLLGESLLIGWVLDDYARHSRLATLLTGGAANGLYTAAGILLTRATPQLTGAGRTTAWTIWSAGALLTACAVLGYAPGIAIATTVLFGLFCPFAWLSTRWLEPRTVHARHRPAPLAG